jgi:hypothetical protein
VALVAMKKANSAYDLAPRMDAKFKHPMKYQSSADLAAVKSSAGHINKSDGGGKHKVVIYFSDAYNNICNKTSSTTAPQASSDNGNGEPANRSSSSSGKDFMSQLKTVLEEKSKFTNKFADNPAQPPSKFHAKPVVPEKPSGMRVQINQQPTQPSNGSVIVQQINEKSLKPLLPSYIESIDENNVIKLKIEQNFKRASELVSLISSMPKRRARKCDASNETSSIHELSFSHEEEIDDVAACDDSNDGDLVSEPDEGYFYDWSFVQEWRSR